METNSKQWIIDHLLPLGEVRQYHGQGNFQLDPNYRNCRFIKERTSSIVRRGISNRSMTNYPSGMISYGYHHAITSAVYHAPEVYHTLEQIGLKVEDELSTFISSCDHAVVLVAHKSIVEQMIVHTHRLPDVPMFSLTVAIRLTHDDLTPIKVSFYSPISENDPQLEQYFNTANLIDTHIDNKKPADIQLSTDRSLFVFNAGLTPHTANFTDDIVLYFVYDNVQFINSGLQKIQLQAQQKLFDDLELYKHVYFWHL